MRRGPALVLGSLAIIFIAVIIAAVLGRGDDAPEQVDSIYGDLSTIPTATAAELDAVDISGIVTVSPDDGSPTPRGCKVKEYTIQPGDIPAEVAASYGVTYEALLELNPGIDSRFIAGETLKIPCPPTPEPTETPDGSSTPGPDDGTSTPRSNGNTITYEVAAGDTAAAIADKFGLTLEELAAANGTSVDALASLQIGDKLKIPNQ